MPALRSRRHCQLARNARFDDLVGGRHPDQQRRLEHPGQGGRERDHRRRRRRRWRPNGIEQAAEGGAISSAALSNSGTIMIGASASATAEDDATATAEILGGVVQESLAVGAG